MIRTTSERRPTGPSERLLRRAEHGWGGGRDKARLLQEIQVFHPWHVIAQDFHKRSLTNFTARAVSLLLLVLPTHGCAKPERAEAACSGQAGAGSSRAPQLAVTPPNRRRARPCRSSALCFPGSSCVQITLETRLSQLKQQILHHTNTTSYYIDHGKAFFHPIYFVCAFINRRN